MPSVDVLAAALGYGILLPAAVTLAVLFLFSARSRPLQASFSGTAEALAVGLGLLAGFAALVASHQLDRKVLTPSDSWHWLPWLALFATAAGALERLAWMPGVLRWCLRLLVTSLAAGILVRAEGMPFRESLAWLAGLDACMFSLWGLLAALANRQRNGVPALLLLLTSLVAGGVIEEAGFGQLAQVAGVLAAVLGSCAWVQWRHADRLVTGAAVPALAVLLPGLLFSGYLNTLYSDVPWTSFLLVAVAPLALGTTGLFLRAQRPRGWRLVVQIAATLLPLVGAAALAATA